MKVLTWNINGLRACKISLGELFRNLDADVICLQETKITRDQLDCDIVNVDGYNAYFSFSKKRSGYSGVVTYCRNDCTPVTAEEGLTGLLSSSNKQTATVIGCYGDQSSFSGEELQALDAEGRTIITEQKYRDKAGNMRHLVIINVYCPRADHENPERISFKMRFYRVLQLRAEALLQAGKSVIIVGDVNASHRRLDHCDPSDDRGHFESHPSRRWLDGFLKDVQSTSAAGEDETTPQSSQEDPSPSPQDRDDVGLGGTKEDVLEDSFIEGEDSEKIQPQNLFVDTFRFFHPKRKNAFTCWSTVTSARQTNYGTRIDYIIADENLCVEEFAECDIMPDFEGSDHCPVKATLSGSCSPAEQLHPLCAKLMPEFAGKQQKLSNFFQKVSPSKKIDIHETVVNINHQNRVGFATGKRSGQPMVGHPSKKAKTAGGKTAKTGNIASFFQKKSTAVAQKQKAEDVQSEMTVMKDHAPYEFSVVSDTSNTVRTVSSTDDSTAGGDLSQGSATSSSDSGTGNQVPGEILCDGLQDSSGEDSQSKPRPKPQLSSAWKNLFKGPPPAPKCRGHKELCVLRTVKKAGPNYGKEFFVCRRPEGHKSNPEARCNHFEWVAKR